MKRTARTRAGLAAVAATLALGLIGCSSDTDDDRCTPVVMFFSTSTGHYHYGSPTGKVVPDAEVPKSARKVSGYKPPVAPKAPAGTGKVKVDKVKPGPAHRAPVRGGRR